MTSTLKIPPWAVHLLAITVGVVTFLASNQEFMGAIKDHPHWILFFHLAAPGFAYLGISQISTTVQKP